MRAAVLALALFLGAGCAPKHSGPYVIGERVTVYEDGSFARFFLMSDGTAWRHMPDGRWVHYPAGVIQ